MDSREGSIVALSPKTRICQWRTGRLQSKFSGNCSTPGQSWWPMQGSEASNHSDRSLIHFVANAASSRMLRWHTADTEALELESHLLSICSLQGLHGLGHSVGTTRSRGWYQLQWTPQIAEGMKNPLKFLASQECPSAVALFWRWCTFFSTTKSFLSLVPE